MPFTAADVFNAIVGYYIVVLAGSAVVGATRALRDPNPGALAAASIDPASGAVASTTAAPAAPPGRAARITGLAHSRTLQAFHRFGWATGVGAALGWLAGRDMYRWATPRVADLARKARERRPRAADTPETEETEPTEPDAPEPESTPEAAEGKDAPPAPGDAPPEPPVETDRPALAPPGPFEALDGTDTDFLPAGWRTTAPLDPADDTPPALTPPGARRRGHLVLVPPPQEYPKIMPAAEIYDMESLVNFTGQVTDATVLESEDAAAASASMIAGAEFAGETATRVADETASLEGAVAAMAMLRVDPESTAAYHALLEAGQVYRDTTATFSVQCHDAAATAAQMATAAANYHETATTALAVLNAHQMPHAEAASATGHSGAHGAFYGVPDTGGQDALAGSGAPQLPAS